MSILSWLNSKILLEDDEILEMLRKSETHEFNNLRKKHPRADVSLEGVDLRGANLSNVNLSNSNLSHVNLSNVNLYGADLTNSNLSNSILYGTDFTNANLKKTNFTFAKFFDTDDDNPDANFTNANTQDTQFLYGIKFPESLKKNQMKTIRWVKSEEMKRCKHENSDESVSYLGGVSVNYRCKSCGYEWGG